MVVVVVPNPVELDEVAIANNAVERTAAVVVGVLVDIENTANGEVVPTPTDDVAVNVTV